MHNQITVKVANNRKRSNFTQNSLICPYKNETACGGFVPIEISSGKNC